MARRKKPNHVKKAHSSIAAHFDRVARGIAFATGRPATFIIALTIIAVWAITGPLFKFNNTWQLVINTSTTIITFLMVFLIQSTQNRDSEALQLKLDELIRAIGKADTATIALEDKSQDELDEIKEQYTKLGKDAQQHIKKRKAS